MDFVAKLVAKNASLNVHTAQTSVVYKAECRRSYPLAMCEKLAIDSNWNVRDALMNLELEIMARGMKGIHGFHQSVLQEDG